jgi:16S rRNA processing protein RimM
VTNLESRAASGRPSLLQVGHVVRPHGVKGRVVVELVTNRLERVMPGAQLVARLVDGGVESLVVDRSTPYGGQRWVVAFRGVDDRNAAERLRGARLEATPIDDPNALWADQLVGSLVEDQYGGRHGRVVALLANPASDLLELEGGGLVPLRFVSDIVEEGSERIVRVVVPAGMFD